MLRSMYTAISGLRNHQTMLDTTANNIANVNTYGFKGSQVTFKDLLSQTLQGASAPTAFSGGTNNRQVGLGMMIDSVSQRHTQGAMASTGTITDLAIQGDGFFRVADDSAAITAGTQETFYARAGNFTLDANGQLVTQEGLFVIGFQSTDPDPTLASPDLAQQSILTIDPSTTSSWSIGQDGAVSRFNTAATPPALEVVGYISLAKFANPAGLTSVGGNKWQESVNSGAEVAGTAGDANGIGAIASGYLEMSNVDLATEFTEMIRAQRGFQANSRVITTSDEILQELVNLKR